MTDLTFRDIELELQRRQHEDPLANVYKPLTDQQLQLHKSRKNTLAIGGNRSGKSYSSVAESQYYATARAVFAEVPKSPIEIWYIVPSMPMFRRAILPIMKRIIPDTEVKRFYRKDNVYEYRNGTTMHILSADMRAKRLQGAAIDLAILDETPDEEVYEEVQARVLTRKGRIILAFAPIDVMTFWVRDKIYYPWLAGDLRDYDVIHMPVADRAGKSLVPWFTEKDVEDMKRRWPDPAVQAARIYGEFVTRSGLVFKTFTPETHIVKPFKIPDSYARWLTCDPQYHRFGALFFAADPDGNYYVTDELFSQDAPLAERAEKIAVMVGRRERSIPMYVDSANPQDTAELNWHFQRLGAPIGAVPLPMRKKVEDMVLRTHALLEPSDERLYPKILELGDVYGAPRIFFFDTLMSSWKHEERDMQCSRLLWEIQRLSWGSDAKPDNESAAGADCCACLVYGCSILQSGTVLPAAEVWQRNLSEADILLWKALEQFDRRRSYSDVQER